MMINDLTNVCQKRWVLYVIYTIMALVVAIPIIGSILKSGVFCDSAYYICMGERISEGYVPYVDLALGYPPLWFYIEAGYKMLFHIPNGVYWPYLILFHAFQIAGAYFLCRLICCLDVKKSYAIFASWLYLMMSHWLQGNFVLIEVPSITFCLLACWLVLEYKDQSYWHYIWIGGLAACSFLVKQYGLGTFALCLFLMLFNAKCGWKEFVMFFAGYLIPIILCLVIWGDSFINHVLLNGYGTQAAADAGYEITFAAKISTVLERLNYFCYMVCPALYVGWMFAPLAYKQNRLANLIFAYCGILGFSLCFYFSIGIHYYQYIIPFAIILMVELLHLTKDVKWRYFVYVMVGWIVLVTFYKTYHNRVYRQYIIGGERAYIYKLANIVSQHVKENETLFVVHGGLYSLYFTADILPPNLGTIGYSFGQMGLNEHTTAEQINSADWVVRYSQDFSYDSYFTDSLKHILESYPAIPIQDSTILLHKMH